MKSIALLAQLFATVALALAVLERRAPGRFPLLDLLRDGFAPAGGPRVRPAWIAGAALAGLALALAPLALCSGLGWTTLEPTGALGWAWVLPGAATFGLKLVWAAFEEIIFRGALCGLLRRRIGVVGAVAASGLVFALAHVPRAATPAGDLGAGVVRFLDGAIYAVLYLTTGSLWAPLAAHAAKNTGVWLATSASSLQLVEGLGRTADRGPRLWGGGPGGSGLVEVLVASGVLAVVAGLAGRRVARRPASLPQARRLRNAPK